MTDRIDDSKAMNDVEAVARAMCCPGGCVAPKFGTECVVIEKGANLEEARAAIKTLAERWMEPSEEMDDAALRAMNDTLKRTGGYAVNSQEIWQAMLKAKLAEIED